MTAVLEPTKPAWATRSDDLDENRETIIWFDDLKVVANQVFNQGEVQVGISRVDRLTDDGYLSEAPMILASNTDENYTVPEARKFARAILDACDRADIDSGDIPDLSEFPFTDLLGSLIRRATKAGNLEDEVSGRLQAVLREAVGR
jgi:hypothetical protein